MHNVTTPLAHSSVLVVKDIQEMVCSVLVRQDDMSLLNNVYIRFEYWLFVILVFFADEDECQNGTHHCDENAQCNNTIGSFNCTCLQGYSGNGVQCSGKAPCHYYFYC